jgi:hypothetical protein
MNGSTAKPEISGNILSVSSFQRRCNRGGEFAGVVDALVVFLDPGKRAVGLNKGAFSLNQRSRTNHVLKAIQAYKSGLKNVL